MSRDPDEVIARIAQSLVTMSPQSPLEALQAATAFLLRARRLMQQRRGEDLEDLDAEIRERALIQFAAERLAVLQGRDAKTAEHFMRLYAQIHAAAERRVELRDARRSAMQ